MEWPRAISAAEKLPEAGSDAFVLAYDNEYGWWLAGCYREFDDEAPEWRLVGLEDERGARKVTHWLPLPPSPASNHT